MSWWIFGIESSLALLTLLSLLVPLVIHLWSKSKGKHIYVGNIALIKVIKPTQMSQIRLVDRLLLLLRLLLLTIATLLLAQLYYFNQESTEHEHILLTDNWLRYSSQEEKQRVADSIGHSENTSIILLSAHPKRLTKDELIHWQAPFKEISTKRNMTETDFTPDNSIVNISQNIQKDNIWLRVENYTKTLIHTDKVKVYTTNQANQFNGNRLTIDHDIQWRVKTIAPEIGALSQKELSIVVVFDENRKNDLEYLQMAFNLLEKSKLHQLSVLYINHNKAFADTFTNTVKQPPQWIFHLSAKPISKQEMSYVEQGSYLFIDAVSTLISTHWQVSRGKYLLSPIHGQLMGVPINISAGDKSIENMWSERSIWQTQTNKKLLTEQQYKQGRIMRFYSRLQADWNDLIQQPQFPQFLLTLLLTDALNDLSLNEGRLSEQQIMSSHQPMNKGDSEKIIQRGKMPLDYVLIILLVFFWCLERLLSERFANKKNGGSSKPEIVGEHV